MCGWAFEWHARTRARCWASKVPRGTGFFKRDGADAACAVENSFEGSFNVGEASDDNRDDHRHDEGAKLNLFEDMCQNDMQFFDDGGHDAKRDRMIWDGASWIPWRLFSPGGSLAEKLKARKGKGSDTGADGDAKLLGALRKLVDRAMPADIAVRLRQLVDVHEAGKGKGKQGKSDGGGGKSDGKDKTAAGGQGRVLSVDGAAKVKGKGKFDGGRGGLLQTFDVGGDGSFLLGVLTTQLFV
ncbi:hypothetical protein AK812_SmicGene19980 [Symbiodinium microadriaticum]|uniref:Uncharacterized protein n=1 Tax=Symbiodinium microadriaticum TaxID=2951 RepID=A0A1Q9DR73_SYMMI|nr:hypothetical protein AK812_SmicGene19980 [Symbiodinium microadriaticum]